MPGNKGDDILLLYGLLITYSIGFPYSINVKTR